MTPIGNQGEVRIDQVEELPDGLTAVDRAEIGFIISHSEQGHHHFIDGDVDVMERTVGVPAGMRILYAIVREPTALRQSAAKPHGEIQLQPGIYSLRIKREFNPFTEQARMVAD